MKILDCPRCGERRSGAGMLGNTGVCLICAEAELTRLRGIEATVMFGGDARDLSIHLWREKARKERDLFWRDAYNAIADALEVKAQRPEPPEGAS